MNNPQTGRWPSHLLISHSAACTVEECVEGCPVKLMDEQSGYSKGKEATRRRIGGIWNSEGDGGIAVSYGDEGGASRYFQTFRPADDSSKHAALMQYLLRLITPPNGTVLDLTNNNTTRQACTSEGFHAISISSSTNDQ